MTLLQTTQANKVVWCNPFEQLQEGTLDVLNKLKSNGIIPTYVQVGNEIPHGIDKQDSVTGFLLDTNFYRLAALLKAGVKAVKQVDPSTKTILHLDNGASNSLYV